MKFINNFLAILPISIVLITSCTTEKKPVESNSAQAATPADDAVIIEVQPQADTLKGSLKAHATGNVDGCAITINYHSPAVRGRVIWGGLVPLNNVWVTGAHKATSVEFSGKIKYWWHNHRCREICSLHHPRKG